MRLDALIYKQHEQEYISFIIPFNKLSEISKVLIYQEDEDGYQRKPNVMHINRIKRFILDDLNGFKLPTSIILGVDEKNISKLIIKDSNNKIQLDISNVKEKLFRIVDGQHRVLGMQKASESLLPDNNDLKKINDYQFNVVTVITKENSRSVELDIFVDINSKGKKVSTDLAELARYNYRIKEKSINKDIPNISEHIAMKCSQELRENDPTGVWNYAIKFDIHSETNIGIIGVSAFRKSITGIIQKYLSKNNGHGLLQLEDDELINACNTHALVMKDFITRCWNESVKIKWSGCFKENVIEDDFDNIVKVYFSNNYYIQKPLGAKSINKLIENSVASTQDLEEAFAVFNGIIENSNVNSQTWKVGGIFSGLNSEGGFKKIREMISNERPIPNS